MSLQRRRVALVVLTGSIAATALACLAWAVAQLRAPVSSTPWMYVVVGMALMAMGAVLPMPLPSRLPIRITLIPTACVVCVAVLPAHWVVICAAFGVAVGRAVRQPSHRVSLHKLIHNTSVDVVTAFVAAAMMYVVDFRPGSAMLGEAGLQPVSVIVAFLAAAVAALVFEELATVAAVTWSTGQPVMVSVRFLWRTRLVVAVGEAVTAVVVAAALMIDSRVLIALPSTMMALYFAVSNRLRIREERRVWLRLNALGSALSSRDTDEVLHTAAAGAVELFGAQSADIELSRDRRLVRAVLRGDAALVAFDGEIEAAPDEAPWQILWRQGFGDHTTGVGGEVRLRLGGSQAAPSERERATLQSFVATLCASLETAHAYGLLAREATHDKDTGLPNRLGLTQWCAALPDESCHVLVVQVENLQFLADTMGQERTRAVLAQVAGRLRKLSADHSAGAARVGDATFALVLRGLTSDLAYQRACRAVALLRQGIEITADRVDLRVSAGMASGAPGPMLLDAAERVLWRALRRGEDRLVSYKAGTVGEWSLARELTQARMSISCEPVVDLGSGQITMVHTVPRWLYSRNDLLAADDYVYQHIKDVEGLQALALQILARSLVAAASWRDALPDAALIVPLPSAALTSQFAARVQELLQVHGMEGPRLVLALSRPPAVSDPVVGGSGGRSAAERVTGMGVRLMLDNYGSRHTDLAALSAADWSFLRLHPAFSLDAGWRPARSVIRAAVDLAADLDLVAVAAGISTHEQRQELAVLGCACGSGELFGGEMFPSQIRTHAQAWIPRPLGRAPGQRRLHRLG
ncbi:MULTISPECIES: EAL domain-containing protein [unclassified Micromonospora]|uniref:EAL domain-containing protein n=1 Tax=unclassified Micromonospora TaxID=2617518 RepID=UPI001C235295|nr:MULTISPECIES: EAL domain-containing protein [unclassified Micromonospora]MBU8857812.1 GGDEF domain-containing protein [Micromonospora sp. WMMB482]MDM4783443.1 EAL domain-containing protein [Micromonospora sp. b486]